MRVPNTVLLKPIHLGDATGAYYYEEVTLIITDVLISVGEKEGI